VVEIYKSKEGSKNNSDQVGKTTSPDLWIVGSKITTHWAPRLVVLPDSIIGELHPLQRQWIHDNIYVTFEFCDHNTGFNQTVHDGIGATLVMLDRHVIEAGSIDPNAHVPLSVSAQAMSDFQCLVGDVYKNRVATWHWTLSLIQSSLLVCFRSLHQGQKPFSELKRLTCSGAKHHVEFLRI
jgi:hypothetical protein